MISSLDNPQVKLARLLKRRSWREKKNLFLIEGYRLVREALEAGYPLQAVFYTPEFGDTAPGRDLIARLELQGYRCLAVAPSLMKTMATTVTPQGILAIAPRSVYPLEEIFRDKPPLVVIADGLQDPGNLGTLWRTALGAGAGGFLITPGTVEPFNPKVVRASMGAPFRLPVAEAEPEILREKLRAWGYKLIVGDVRAEEILWDADLSFPLALAVGGEARGVSAPLLAGASAVLRIPFFGMESLNAAIAGAIFLYEILRQNRSYGS